jgi:hypothetical protein
MSRARFAAAVACAFLGAGCIVHEHHHIYHRTEVAADYTYFGAHPVPLAEGGGWCLLDGEHVHAYAPDYDDYAYDGQDYVYDGPIEVPYDGEHYIPEGGFCYLEGIHFHDYLPLGGDAAGLSWSPTSGAYTYRAAGIGFHPAAPILTSRGGGGGAPSPGPGSAPLAPTALRGHLGGPPGWQSAPPVWGPPLQRPPPAARNATYSWRGPVAPPAASVRRNEPAPSPYQYQPPMRSWTVPNASGYAEPRTEVGAPVEGERGQPLERFEHGAPLRSSAPTAAPAPGQATHVTPSSTAGHSAPATSSSHSSSSSGSTKTH